MAAQSSTPTMEHDPIGAATLETVERLIEAFSRHDVDGVMALMSEAVVFESTMPPPDGARHEGQAAARAVWEELFRASSNLVFETEGAFAGDRCVVRWLYRWAPDEDANPGRVRDGKVAEKLSYVKG